MSLNHLITKNKRIFSHETINKFINLTAFEDFNIKKINFKFSSTDIAFISNFLDEETLLDKMYPTIILYLLLGTYSEITAIKKKTEKRNTALVKGYTFDFDLKLKNKNRILQFLTRLVLESNFIEKNLKKDKLNSITIQQRNTFSYNTKIITTQFYELQDSFETYDEDCNLSKAVISTNFIVNLFPKKLLKIATLESLFIYKMAYNY
jgi:hypothetical protein